MDRVARVTLSSGVFLVALVSLMVELLLIRVFDVILVNNLGYMIISCVLFAFGLAGVYAALRPLRSGTDSRRYLAGLSLALAASCILQFPSLNLNPLSLEQVVETPLRQGLYFLLIYLGVTAPFFVAGLILIRVFSVHAHHIRRLYCFDLFGAAIGAIIVVPLMRPLGPGGLLFAASGLALIAAGLFLGKVRHLVVATAVAVALTAVPIISGAGYYDFRPHLDKRGVLEAFDAGAIEMVIGGMVAAIGSIYLGFSAMLVTGFAIYVAAFLAFALLRGDLAQGSAAGRAAATMA